MSIVKILKQKNLALLKEEITKENRNINEVSEPAGYTLLMRAISEEFTEGALLLINNGINVSILDKNGDSSLNFAVEYNNVDIAKAILEKDGNIINVGDSIHNNIPIWHAIFAAFKSYDVDYSMIDLLMSYGADLYHKNAYGGNCIDLIKEQDGDDILDYIKQKYPNSIH